MNKITNTGKAFKAFKVVIALNLIVITNAMTHFCGMVSNHEHVIVHVQCAAQLISHQCSARIAELAGTCVYVPVHSAVRMCLGVCCSKRFTATMS